MMSFSQKTMFYLSLLFFTGCTLESENSKAIFDSFDKTKIAYTDEGKGQPVILIHGFISSGSSWNSTVLKEKLLNSGFRVIIPDLRGNGNSDKPRTAAAYQNNAEVKDLAALANHLRLKNFTAVGYSRGAIVLAKWLTLEKRITKAVIGGMGLDFSNPNWERRLVFADAFSGRAPLNEMTEGAVKYAESIGANLEILGLLQDFQPVTSLQELNNIKTEILVIAGNTDTDNGSPADLQNQLSNSRLIIVPGDHNTTYRKAPFAEAVIDFLKN